MALGSNFRIPNRREAYFDALAPSAVLSLSTALGAGTVSATELLEGTVTASAAAVLQNAVGTGVFGDLMFADRAERALVLGSYRGSGRSEGIVARKPAGSPRR